MLIATTLAQTTSTDQASKATSMATPQGCESLIVAPTCVGAMTPAR